MSITSAQSQSRFARAPCRPPAISPAFSAAPFSAPAEVEVPSRYGEDDTIGALNEITEAKVAEAAGLVRRGRRYQLAQILDDSSPAQMWR